MVSLIQIILGSRVEILCIPITDWQRQPLIFKHYPDAYALFRSMIYLN